MSIGASTRNRFHVFCASAPLWVLFVIGGAAFPSMAFATVFTVNSTGDAADSNPFDGVCQTATPGECTLRAAIAQANSDPGSDTIAFNIPGPGPHTIQPASDLLAITDPVTIDGYTQPGASPNTNGPGLGSNAVIRIELDGGGARFFGLHIRAGDSTVRGLAINRFVFGVFLTIGANDTIEGNFIGTDVTGTVAAGNVNGVFMSTADNAIGGTTPEARNVISGNIQWGIVIAGSTGNAVLGNLIGTDATGTTLFGSGDNGITLTGPGNTIGGTSPEARNVISGNLWGVIITGSLATGNDVQGNFIGTDVTGTVAVANKFGVSVRFGASSNRIGGTAGGAGNVISGNGIGVFIDGDDVTDNSVVGNFIGTDSTGTVAIGNSFGVEVHGLATTIGGPTAEARNIVSGNQVRAIGVFSSHETVIQGNFVGTDVSGIAPLGNGSGVLLGGMGDTGTNNLLGGTVPGSGNVIAANAGNGVEIGGTDYRVLGNFIGTDVSGTIALGNLSAGVRLDGSNNAIGGTAAGAGNVIAFSGSFGGVFAVGGTGNAILSNRIFSSAGFGIHLVGVTSNDPGDGDVGPNNGQNYPVLTSVTSGTGLTTIAGTLNSASNSTFRLEFFSNTTCDLSGFGEGETPLGATDVTTDSGGNVAFAVTFAVTVPVGHTVTATATDAGNNTSEFSQCYVATPPANSPPVANAGGPYTLDEGGTVQLSGSGTDPGGDPLTFAWDLDDNGTFETSGQTPAFSAVDGPSTHQVKLRVCDPLGACDTDSATITVNNVAPVVNAGPPQVVFSGQTVTMSATFSDAGVDDDPWLYSIDWDDASSDTGSTSDQGSPITANHTYFAPGDYTIEVCVTDKDGGQGCATEVVSVLALPVLIDIKPGSDPNSINCGNAKETITVAILSNATFDATTIDHTTVVFEGAGETHLDPRNGRPRRHEEDVNHDRRVDLVLHFRLGDTTLTCGSTEGTLRGMTFTGQWIAGTDAVRMVGGR